MVCSLLVFIVVICLDDNKVSITVALLSYFLFVVGLISGISSAPTAITSEVYVLDKISEDYCLMKTVDNSQTGQKEDFSYYKSGDIEIAIPLKDNSVIYKEGQFAILEKITKSFKHPTLTKIFSFAENEEPRHTYIITLPAK